VGAVWIRVRAEVRARWRAWLGLCLLAGMVGGVVIGAVAGGRRTASAHARLIEATNTPDAFLPVFSWLGLDDSVIEDLRALPEVREVVRFGVFGAFGENELSIFAPRDARASRSLVPKLLEGRRPRPDRPEEVMVSFPIAREAGITTGDRITTQLQAEQGPRVPVELRVVGVSALPLDFPSGAGGGLTAPGLVATRAFVEAHAHQADVFSMLGIHLDTQAGGVAALERRLEQRLGDQALLFVQSTAEHAVNIERSNGLQAIAVWAFAAVVGLSGALILAQMVTRQTMLESADDPTLQALGVTRMQLLGVALARAGIVAISAVILGVGVAVASSPLFPLGVARIAEPSPGVRVDGAALAVGAGALLVVILVSAAIPAARRPASNARVRRTRPAALGEALSRAGARPSAVAGIRLAFDRGRGRSAVPVRSTLTGVVLGVATLVMALGFGASITHLIGTPLLWGNVVDASFYVEDDGGAAAFVDRIAADRRIEAFSIGTGGPLQIDELTLDALFHRGTLEPAILEGRAAEGPNADAEIVVGSQTLRALGKRIGDTVRVSIPGARRSMEAEIVGRAVFPPLGDSAGLGRGAWISYVGLSDLVGEAAEANEVAMRFAPGVDHPSTIAEYEALLGSPGGGEGPTPALLLDFGRVENLPVVLAGTLAALAALTLAHMLLSSIRRRRRDLAILKTLGFARRDLRRTVQWQSATLTAAGVGIGLPVGIIAARWLWEIFANRIGVVAEPVVPALGVAIVVPAAFAVASMIALGPGRAAARTAPALVLRSE